MASSGHLKLLRVAPDLDASGAVFESMLAGWRQQQPARNLNMAKVLNRRPWSHGKGQNAWHRLVQLCGSPSRI